MRITKCIITSVVLLVMSSVAIAQTWGVIRYADGKINIRASRSTNSKVVGQLSKGQKIRADFLSENWYAIFDPNEVNRNEQRALGYVYAPLLKPIPPKDKLISSPSFGAIEYKIVKKEDVSYQGTPRMVNRVILDVSKIPEEAMMRKAAVSIWNEGNRGWKEFTEIVPKNRTAILVERKLLNCCHYEKKQTQIQCRFQDQSGA